MNSKAGNVFYWAIKREDGSVVAQAVHRSLSGALAALEHHFLHNPPPGEADAADRQRAWVETRGALLEELRETEYEDATFDCDDLTYEICKLVVCA